MFIFINKARFFYFQWAVLMFIEVLRHSEFAGISLGMAGYIHGDLDRISTGGTVKGILLYSSVKRVVH